MEEHDAAQAYIQWRDWRGGRRKTGGPPIEKQGLLSEVIPVQRGETIAIPQGSSFLKGSMEIEKGPKKFKTFWRV